MTATRPKLNLSERWMNDDEWNTHVRCPHCGDRTDDDEWLMGESGCSVDGDSATISCDACGKKFVLTLSVSLYWRSEPCKGESEFKYVEGDELQRMWQQEHRKVCGDPECEVCFTVADVVMKSEGKSDQ